MTREELDRLIDESKKAERTALTYAVKAARATVAAARAWYELAQADPASRPEDIERFRANLTRAQLKLAQAESDRRFWN
jgi:hypothetical protein